MANTDPYISDSLDYIYLDIDQTTLEPNFDEYGGASGHIITSTEYLSVLSSPSLTYGRKYLVYCVFFVTGAEEDFYDYRIIDGLGTPFPDGVFNIENTQAQGTGFDDTSNNGTYGSWFKIFYANSNSPIYFETKAKGVDNYSAVYYAQFLTIDITDLKEDYHYFYKEDKVSTGNVDTKYTIQPDEDGDVSSKWLLMSSYSNLNLRDTIGVIKLFNNGNFVYADEGAVTGVEGWDETNRPKTIFNTISLSSDTEISLKFDPSSGHLFYPKLFGLRMDLFDDNVFHNGGSTSSTLQTGDSTLSLGSAEVTAKNSEYFILGQVSQDGMYTYEDEVLTVRSNIGISCDVTVDGSTILSYPIDQYSIVHGIDLNNASFPELDHLRNQIIPISLHIPAVNDSMSVQFTIHNNNIPEAISFNHFKYSILSNKVKRYAPKSISLKGKPLKEIYPDMMVCSYTNSGIDSDSSILGGFDTQDPRNYVIDGLGNKLPFRLSSTMKDYFFDRGKIENPLMDQELHYVLSLGNIPERPYPSRTDIFDIDEYDCLAATLYDDVVISLRSKYFEDDMDSINETIEFYMVLDKQEWYDAEDPITIGEYISYNNDGVAGLNHCSGQSGTCLLKLNFTDWNLSSTEKKIFHFFTHNVKNEHTDKPENEHKYWFVKEIKTASNINRISRHFNYENVFIEDTATDFIDLDNITDIRKKSKFVFKDSTSLSAGETHQTDGRVRSFQATDIFNDNDELGLSEFIDRTEEELRIDLEFQLLGAGADTTDPYYYATLDSSNPLIYFYMPPDWARLHLAYKLIDEDLFDDEQATRSKWASITWTSSLFENYVTAISRRLKVLRETLVEGKYSSTFSYNKASRVGLYAYRTNFYGDSTDIETLNTTDYLMQYAYESAASDHNLLEHADYLQIELFPRWGSLDSYSDSDLEDHIDMHLEYAEKVVNKETSSNCRLFPLITHKVRNSSSNSYLMVLTKDEMLKFINRIDYHIDKINYSFWEYGIYNESNYSNNYVTPSDTVVEAGLGYTGGYIDSYPWTTDDEDPNGLQIDESLQPYLHGGANLNTTLVCYFYNLFADEDDFLYSLICP